MERFGEGPQGMDPGEPYPRDPYPRDPREAYPMATQLNPRYEYYPGEATLGAAAVAGLLAAAAGAWLVIGPDAYTVVRHVGANGRTLPTRSLASLVTQVGYYLGPGVLLAVFGGMALGVGPHRCRPGIGA